MRLTFTLHTYCDSITQRLRGADVLAGKVSPPAGKVLDLGMIWRHIAKHTDVDIDDTLELVFASVLTYQLDEDRNRKVVASDWRSFEELGRTNTYIEFVLQNPWLLFMYIRESRNKNDKNFFKVMRKCYSDWLANKATYKFPTIEALNSEIASYEEKVRSKTTYESTIAYWLGKARRIREKIGTVLSGATEEIHYLGNKRRKSNPGGNNQSEGASKEESSSSSTLSTNERNQNQNQRGRGSGNARGRGK